MKEKILAQLKQKYAGVSAILLGLYADKLAAKVTTEDQIEGAVNELDNLPISIIEQNRFYQTEGDRRATEAAATREAKLKEQFNFVDKSTPPNPPSPPSPPVQNPEIEALKKKLEQFEKNEIRSKQLLKAQSLLDEKKIPKPFYSKILERTEFTTDEDIDKVVNEIDGDYSSFKQSLIDEGLLGVEKPVFGTPNTEGVSPAMGKFITEKGAEQSNSLGAKKL